MLRGSPDTCELFHGCSTYCRVATHGTIFCFRQQDSQEFLRYLLEGLHEDVNRVAEKPPLETTDIPEKLSDAQKASEAWKRYLKRDNSKIVGKNQKVAPFYS